MVEIRAMFKRTRLPAIAKLVMVLISDSYAIGAKTNTYIAVLPAAFRHGYSTTAAGSESIESSARLVLGREP